MAAVDAAGAAILAALAAGHQVLLVGNGGSAAMASHVAAEFAGKCVMDRRPLPALSLAESSTTVTAVANDYGFEQVFVRGVRAFGRPGDVAARHVDQRHLRRTWSLRSRWPATWASRRILLTGEGAVPAGLADHVLQVPSGYTPRIQEVHLLWSHAWCEAVDVAWADLP